MRLTLKADMGRYLDAPPRAGVMIEALRGLGYSTPSAVADIIDNSIAAASTEVRLWFHYRGRESFVTISDDGCGMDRDNLIRAMRMGVINPLDERSINDLGRFGLGLKTASFSQCRCLTVVSLCNNLLSSFRWDLDVLANSGNDSWRLMEGPFEDAEEHLIPRESIDHGTAVIWNDLDRMVTDGFTEQNFLDLVDRVENHLAMVFHRFIEGPHPAIRIMINDKPVVPWDPFMLNHPSTWSSPVEKFHTPSGTVEIQCHVLPHKDRLNQREFDVGAGPAGWTAQQGFYIYRNRRLLVPGNWLNLGQGRSWTKEEAHKLARIRVDIPNTADQEWKIDVRKSTAVFPVGLRSRLAPLADYTRKQARQIFVNRGVAVSKVIKGPIEQAWLVQHDSDSIRYRIDKNHLAVSSVIEQSGQLRDAVLAMIRVIEETVPIQRIWLDTAEGKNVSTEGFKAIQTSDLTELMIIFYRNMILKKGYSPRTAKEKLLKTEPFHMYPEIIAGLPEDRDAFISR